MGFPFLARALAANASCADFVFSCSAVVAVDCRAARIAARVAAGSVFCSVARSGHMAWQDALHRPSGPVHALAAVCACRAASVAYLGPRFGRRRPGRRALPEGLDAAVVIMMLAGIVGGKVLLFGARAPRLFYFCLLYTSDAADE